MRRRHNSVADRVDHRNQDLGASPINLIDSGTHQMKDRFGHALDQCGLRRQTASMSKQEVDAYIEALDQRQQSALSELRQTILEIVPEAEQCMAYGIPGFRLRGKIIAGFAAFQHHLSYFPHSGSVLPVLQEEVADYSTSKGTLRFSVDKPLPRQLVQRLLAVRVEQALKKSLD